MTDAEFLRDYVIYVNSPIMPLRCLFAMHPGAGPAEVWLDMFDDLPLREEHVVDLIRVVGDYPWSEPTLCFEISSRTGLPFGQFRVIVQDKGLTVTTGMPKALQERLTKLTGKTITEEKI